MSVVLAALDSSAAARPVLETALGLGQLTGARVEAVHVQDGPSETPETLAARSGVPYRLLEGPAEAALLLELAAPQAIAAVLGARGTPGGRRPVGRTALRVLERAGKPVVVVPPEAAGVSPRSLRRLLVPLEGTDSSSRPVLDCLCPLLVGEVELVVLHVFTDHTMPRILDRPGRDLELLGSEFLARHCPRASGIELRTGPVAPRVAEVGAEQAADLVVLSWSQDSSSGRARVVRDVLGHSVIPVLLLPTGDAPTIDLAEQRDRSPARA